MSFIKRHHWNTGIYLGVSLLSKAASTVLLIPLYTSRMSRAEYGAFGLCQTLYSIVPPLLTLSLTAAFARFYFDRADEATRTRTLGGLAIGVMKLALCAAAALELVLDVVPHAHVGDLSRTELRLVLWTCALTPISDLPALFYRQEQKALHFAALNLTQFALATSTTAYLLVVRRWGLLAPLTGIFVGQLVGASFSAYLTFGRLRVDLSAAEKGLLWRGLRYSIPFIPHAIGNALLVGADRWALEFYGYREELGLYTLAMQLTLPIVLATGAWNEATAPGFFAAWRDGGVAAARRSLPRIVIGFVLCGSCALVAVMVGLPILRIVVGKNFQPAFPLIPWIGGGLVVGAMFSAFVSVLEYRKATRIIPFLTLGSVAVNIGLNFVLVPRFVIHGAIAATTVAYVVRIAILWVVARRGMHAAEREERAAAAA